MNIVYVLMVERWGGQHYQTEVVEVFKDEEVAYRVALANQCRIPICDVRYYVVDKLNDKAWNLYLTDTHICDCERNHGGECKYPNKQEGGCR